MTQPHRKEIYKESPISGSYSRLIIPSLHYFYFKGIEYASSRKIGWTTGSLKNWVFKLRYWKVIKICRKIRSHAAQYSSIDRKFLYLAKISIFTFSVQSTLPAHFPLNPFQSLVFWMHSIHHLKTIHPSSSFSSTINNMQYLNQNMTVNSHLSIMLITVNMLSRKIGNKGCIRDD